MSTHRPDLRPDDLDARAAAAAADVHRLATARPRPPFDPSRSADLAVPAPAARPHRARSLVAVAAAFALLAGAGAWWAGSRDGADDDRARVTADGVRPFLAGEDRPERLALVAATELDPTDRSGEGSSDLGPIEVFGPDADHPGLGTMVEDGWEPDAFGTGATPKRIDGIETYRFDRQGLGRTGVAAHVGDHTVLLFSPTLDGDALGALAAGTTVRGSRVAFEPGVLPPGWTRLGDDPSLLATANPFGLQGGGTLASTVHLALYAEVDPADGGPAELGDVVAVTSLAGDAVVAGAPALLVRDREDVSVHGRPAILGTLDPGPGTGDAGGWLVSWSERPGEVVRVSAYGLTRAEVLALADGVRPATGDEWEARRRDTLLGKLGVGEGSGPTIGEGTFADGTPWVLRLLGTGGAADVDLRVALDGDTSSSSSGFGTAIGAPGDDDPPADPLGSTTVTAYGDRAFAYGLVDAAVASVELRADDRTVATATVVDGAGRRGFVVELPAGDRFEVVALDRAGAALSRRASDRPRAEGSSGPDADDATGSVLTPTTGGD